MIKLKSLFAVAVIAAATAAPQAFAVGPDYSTITAGVDWASAITGILAVAALLVGVYGAVKGARILIGMVRGS